MGANLIGPSKTYKQRLHSWMNISLILDERSPMKVRKVKEIFESHGVETRPIIAGNLARHPVCKNIVARFADDLSVSDKVLNNGFMIGCHPHVSQESLADLEKAFAALKRL